MKPPNGCFDHRGLHDDEVGEIWANDEILKNELVEDDLPRNDLLGKDLANSEEESKSSLIVVSFITWWYLWLSYGSQKVYGDGPSKAQHVSPKKEYAPVWNKQKKKLFLKINSNAST